MDASAPYLSYEGCGSSWSASQLPSLKTCLASCGEYITSCQPPSLSPSPYPPIPPRPPRPPPPPPCNEAPEKCHRCFSRGSRLRSAADAQLYSICESECGQYMDTYGNNCFPRPPPPPHGSCDAAPLGCSFCHFICSNSSSECCDNSPCGANMTCGPYLHCFALDPPSPTNSFAWRLGAR